MDVKSVFLHCNLAKVIHIKLPEGYLPTIKENVCPCLKKSLYGLRQSRCNWQLKIKSVFIDASLQPSAADPCLFIKSKGEHLFVFLHVDDLIIGGKDLDAFCADISSELNMKDLGELQFVL
ncbi:hypothetical protein O181_101694 [Austropuccinia psidii MF-1]|uniref:Reverse transcriptase Ty1/copia-type domain-containing protein n=1 Tax=Austropuccinia psidii MF-1 TaxID=1389203 RepID=A0A9Q3PHJ7_9BASI|nr:hypothetical protein [Austropuccinia psidii MF-1]